MTFELRLLMAVEVTLCYVPGLLLRISPFRTYLSQKKKKILLVVYPTLLILNVLFLFAGLRNFEAATPLIRLDMLLIQLVLVGANVIIVREYKREHLFTFGLVAACMYTLLSSATYLSQFFFVDHPTYQYLLGTGLYIIFMILCYSPIRSILRETVSTFLNRKCMDYWKNVWFVPMLLYVSMYMAVPVDQNTCSLPMLLNRLYVSIAVVIFNRVVAANHQTILQKQALEAQLDNSRLHYAGMQAKVESARKTRHDLKHILNAVRQYIAADDKAALSDFCDALEETQLQNSNVPYTGCPAVDGLMYHYIKRADESDVRFQYHGNFANSGIADLDFCILIGNALENAFDGCLSIEDQRFVTLTMERDENILSAMIQNSFDGKVNVVSDRIFSRKREQRVGIGLENMKAVCEKYNGTMKNEWDEHTFTVMILLRAESNT